MAILTTAPVRKRVLDLTGPEGNAYWLLGFVSANGKHLGYDKQKIEEIQNEMREKDYDHLVKVFDKYFGEIVDVVLPEVMQKANVT